MKNTPKTLCHLLLILASVMILLTGISRTVLAAEGERTIEYGDYTFTKISNPTTGEGEADGINTNDETGFPPNRMNSYAWAVTSRGDYIYIGTNRTLFGSALNAVMKNMPAGSPLTPELVNNALQLLTLGDFPDASELTETDYIPQIIRFDVENGTTKVIYQPKTAVRADERLCYTDKDGNIIDAAEVTTETASFRSVVQFNGNLYFGSLGVNMLQLVRVDQDDNADVVFQTIGLINSLRAGCVHDDGNGETVYFGGQDTTYGKWRREYGTAAVRPLPIVIRRLDPATAGTDAEDWSELVADYDDFGEYACATVYRNGGGNVWDLISFNGRLYLILAYDDGWVMFRGENGGDDPNDFGWTWTEIVGYNSILKQNPQGNPAVIPDIEMKNSFLQLNYGCQEYGLSGSGLLESTGTPFVFNGKMYIGSFDNATTIQTETVQKALRKLSEVMAGRRGPTLSQIFAPIYEVMAHPQHIWVMGPDEYVQPVEQANALLENTTNDYVWRFIEHNGKLYVGTFDSSSAFRYFLGWTPLQILKWLERNGIVIPDEIRDILDGDIITEIQSLLYLESKDAVIEKSDKELAFITAIENAISSLEKFYQDDIPVEDILDDMVALQAARDDLYNSEEGTEAKALSDIADSLRDRINKILDFFDIEGLTYWIKARRLVNQSESGFDILVTEDGENWERIVADGLDDIYNYGARTFTILNDELYIGTANPYYGAQLWKIKGDEPVPPVPPVPPTPFIPICHECNLPNTGFSTRHVTNLSVRPDGLEYKDLNLVLQIPSLDVETELVEIPLVDNSWPAEWLGANGGLLSGSAVPGKGYSVIAAHNTLNSTEIGPFAALSSMQKNDLIFVSGPHGKLIRYSVYANELLAPDGIEAMKAIAGKEPGALILVTCENESVDGGYLNRRVVFAKPF